MTKHELEQMTDAELHHFIACCYGSMDSLKSNTRTSMHIAMAQQVLSQRGAKQLGANLCGGGSKQRCKAGRGF